MDREDDIETCADCGAPTVVGRERGYAAGSRVLCFACALERGGSYDSDQDRWTVPPRADDLLDEDHRER